MTEKMMGVITERKNENDRLL